MNTARITLCIVLMIFFCNDFAFAQHDERITSIDFVEILNGDREEAIYYYLNNWKVLREMAVENDYIHSFELLETARSPEQPFDLMLITTYANQDQYEKREPHFQELIKQRGDLKLLNDKKPGEFRKTLFSKSEVRHFEKSSK